MGVVYRAFHVRGTLMRSGPVLVVLGVVLIAFLVAGCGASGSPQQKHGHGVAESGPPVKLEVATPYYVPGEQFQWEISLRGFSGARAVMAVGEPGMSGDRSVVILRSRVQSVGVAAVVKHVRDDVTSWVELDGGAPVFHRADVQFGSREAAIETRFGPGPFHINVSRIDREPRTYTQAIPAGHTAHDIHSLLGTLRAWQAEVGTDAYAYVLSGRHIWHLTTTYAGTESIRTKLGEFEAVRIDGVAWRLDQDLRVNRDRDPRLVTLWLAADGTRAPLRVEAVTEHGTVLVELVDYDRPAAHLTAAPL
jgi:hypothetical protein